MNALSTAASGRLRGELARFVLVGITSVVIDFAVYRGLLALAIAVHPAKTAGYIAGAVFGYFANRSFTFRVGAQWRQRELLSFIAVYLIALGANVVVNSLVLAVLGRGEIALVSAFVAATGVSAAMNFVGLKLFVFGANAAVQATTAAPARADGAARLSLSLVIPCYNEAANLPLLVARLRETFLDDRAEVVLVDNGSTDDSPAVLARLLAGQERIRSVRVEVNQGYGYGILTGLRAARGDVLGWTHADMQTDPQDALRGLVLYDQAADPARVFVKGRRYGRPAADVAFTVGMSVFETVLMSRRMWDINAQPTLFPRAFFERWREPPHDFALDLYAYYQALRDGLRVQRFAVRFGERAHGSSHWNVNWQAKLRFIKRTVDFSLRLRQGLQERA
ncbi:glycosyltransferase [Lysobacter capsici]|uniref:glycosyltransferase n=1 Tax=Lysobacter capsici TaxID=435897 RepID=UPI0013649408|nr:glycosyltransferase [Lysobacter capsici]